MNGRNVATLGVSAVIIVACLVFSFIYLDDGGGDDSAPRSEYVIGDTDTYLYRYTGEDGRRYQTSYSVTITAIDGDLYTAEYRYGNERPNTVTGTYDEIFIDTSQGFELVGEDVEIEMEPLGTTEVCDVYVRTNGDVTDTFCTDQYGKVVYTFTTAQDYVTEMWLYDSTLYRDALSFGSSTVNEDVGLGDYILFYWDFPEVRNVPVMMNVLYNEDGLITYYSSYREGTVTCSFEDFISLGQEGDYVGSGEYLIDNGSYGERICELYVIPDETYGYQHVYVGKDDGVCYRVDLVDADGNVVGGGDMTYATMVSGDFPMTEPRDPVTGDYMSYIYTYTDQEGGTDVHVVTVEVLSEIDGIRTVATYSDDVFVGYVDGFKPEPVPGDVVGSQTLHTVYGDVVCDMIAYQDEDGTGYIDWVHDGTVFRSLVSYEDGRIREYTLIFDTTVEEGVAFDICFNTMTVTEGSWFMYDIYIDGEWNGTTGCDVVSVDGDTAMVSFDGGEPSECSVFALLNGYPVDRDAVLVGYTILETSLGTFVCDVFQVQNDLGTVLVYQGADDGVVYRMEFDLDGSTYALELQGSSTVF